MIGRYFEDVPCSYLRLEENQAFFLLLTLKGDPNWRYRVDKLHPRAREVLLVLLLTHRNESNWVGGLPKRGGPLWPTPSPTAGQEDTPLPKDKTSKEEPTEDEGEPTKEEDLEEDPSKDEEEPMEEEDTEEVPGEDEEEPMEEENPEKDPSKDKEEATEEGVKLT